MELVIQYFRAVLPSLCLKKDYRKISPRRAAQWGLGELVWRSIAPLPAIPPLAEGVCECKSNEHKYL
jgi:hypothetical protein